MWMLSSCLSYWHCEFSEGMDVSSVQNNNLRASVPDPLEGSLFLWERDWRKQPGTTPGTQTGSEVPLWV